MPTVVAQRASTVPRRGPFCAGVLWVRGGGCVGTSSRLEVLIAATLGGCLHVVQPPRVVLRGGHPGRFAKEGHLP